MANSSLISCASSRPVKLGDREIRLFHSIVDNAEIVKDSKFRAFMVKLSHDYQPVFKSRSTPFKISEQERS